MSAGRTDDWPDYDGATDFVEACRLSQADYDAVVAAAERGDLATVAAASESIPDADYQRLCDIAVARMPSPSEADYQRLRERFPHARIPTPTPTVRLRLVDPGRSQETEAFTFEGVKLSEVRGERIRWYVQDLVPKGHHTVLAADGKTGKGLFVLWLAATAIDGPVLYLGAEDNLKSVLKPRAQALGFDIDRFIPLHKILLGDDGKRERVPLRFPSDEDTLRDAVAHYGAEAVVIDSGVEYMDDGLNSNKTEDVRKLTACLNRVAEDLDVTVLDILHTNKSKDASGAGRILGSTTWKNAGRHILMMAADGEDEDVRHVEVVQTNIGKRTGYGRRYRISEKAVPTFDPDSGLNVDEPQPYLVDEGESDASVVALLDGSGDDGDAGVDDLILAYLLEHGETSGGVLDAAVAESSGCTKRTVGKHRTKLRKAGLIEAVPTRTEGAGVFTSWSVRLTLDGRAELDRQAGDARDW